MAEAAGDANGGRRFARRNSLSLGIDQFAGMFRRAAQRDGAFHPVGTKAPAFSVPDQNGTTVSLADQAGHWVLLWWYPKASTPG